MRVLYGILFIAFCIVHTSPCRADDMKFYPPETFLNCDKTCAVTVFGGKLVEANLGPGDINSAIVAGTLSRVLDDFKKI